MLSFVKAAAKTLRTVEINSFSSNQHEFNGVAALKKIFGYNKIFLKAKFYYLSDTSTLDDLVDLTWYDARENDPNRSEYRLYYSDNDIIYNANVGDLLLIGINQLHEVHVLIIDKDSSSFCTICSLFGIQNFQNNYIIKQNIACKPFE